MSRAASSQATLVRARDRDGPTTASHNPTARREPLAISACDRRRRAPQHAAGIGRAIDHRAVAPNCWIVQPLFVGVGVMLILLVMTDIAIMARVLARPLCWPQGRVEAAFTTNRAGGHRNGSDDGSGLRSVRS
jgi:hypothetical protein